MKEMEHGSEVVRETDLDLLALVYSVVDSFGQTSAKKGSTITVDVSSVHHRCVCSDENILRELMTDILLYAALDLFEAKKISVSLTELFKLRTGYAHYSLSVKTAEAKEKQEYNDGQSVEEHLLTAKKLVGMLRGDMEVEQFSKTGICITVTLGLKLREGADTSAGKVCYRGVMWL